MGAFFFLQQQQLIPNNLNWWALFLLVQGIVLLFEALTQRNAVHEMEMGKLVGGTILALIGLGFLLNLQGDLLPNLPWATIWPLFLIVGGVALLLRRSDQGGRSPN